MFFEFFFAILIALLLTAVFAAGFRRQGWGTALVFFFLILFLATWAGGMWVVPFGPIAWGVPWVAYLFVGIVIALLITALIPPVGDPPIPEENPG
jgi:peptidoglycan/LPS O-acetylase OafA/YrhL